MYRAFLPGQADPELQKRIVALESEVEQTFNTFRATVDGKTLTENDVREIIATTKDPAAAEAAWKAYMEVGRRVEPKLRELVKLRNEMARQLGFDNYQALRLKTQEIDPDELMKLFDELDALTAAPFAEFKAKLDARRAVWFGIGVAELRPWSYGDLFFQEAPPAEESGLDNLFKNADLVEIATRYFDGLGMQVADILARSSLYEQPGKTPHAFATDIDRAGDVRILLNLQPNAYWADTILHELGHAVYDVYIDSSLPFLLRTASHGITTEGVALMYGAMSKNEQWLKEFLGLEAAEAARAGAAAREALQAEKLIFSRWAQVMVRFEQGMYADPDQDLGKLWWDLKRKYQLLNPPEDTGQPDYAAKAHIVTTPIYYHNYLMGELFAAQIRAQIAKDVLGGADPVRASFINQPAVGAWLRERVFAPGNLYSWNELTRRATGAPLSATFFAQEYVR
jgi:peptidyl-dipeptidase A